MRSSKSMDWEEIAERNANNAFYVAMSKFEIVLAVITITFNLLWWS